MNRSTRLALLAGVALSTPVAPALAQSPSSNEVAGEAEKEILVTATRRLESANKIPQSISVLSGEDLAAAGAEGFKDYLVGVPGVSFYENGNQTNAIFIRGVSSGVNLTADSTTGIYIDEAPVTQAIGGTVDLQPFDLERVEILRGPQGTLFGSSSMGGTVRLILNKPDTDAFTAVVEADGSIIKEGGIGYEVNGMANIPLIKDQLAVRLVAGYRFRPGYIDDVPNNEEDYNTNKSTSLRAALRWTPTSDTTIDLFANYQKLRYVGYPQRHLQFGALEGGYPYQPNGAQPFLLVGANVEHDMGFATLTLASNYMRKKAYIFQDSTRFFPLIAGRPAGADDFLAFRLSYGAEVLSQEVRLASNGNGPLQWIVGTFYMDGTAPNLELTTVASVPVVPSEVYEQQQTSSKSQVAGFGEISYKLTDRLTVTAGLRYSHYKTTTQTVEAGFFSASGGPPLASTTRAEKGFLDQKYQLDFQFTDDNLLYAKAASGSRPGDDSLTSSVIEACRPAGLPDQTKPDSLWTYEIGSKNRIGRGASVNAAGYVTEWKDIQTQIPDACGTNLLRANAGAARIKGLELEVALNPLPGLSLTGGVSYVHTKITEGNPGIGAVKGERLPLVPRWNGNIAARYEFTVADGIDVYLRGGLSAVSDQLPDFRPNLNPYPAGYRTLKDYITANARIGIIKDDRYEVALYATNITDERVVTAVVRGTPARVNIMTPRTVGINVRADL